MLNITNIPAPRVPFIDERTNLMSREWYRFFLNLFVLTGSGSNATSITDLLIAPQASDLSGDFIDTATQTQLASWMANYENLESIIQGAYLEPSIDTSKNLEDSIQGAYLQPVLDRCENLEDLIQGAYLAPMAESNTVSIPDDLTVVTLNATTVNTVSLNATGNIKTTSGIISTASGSVGIGTAAPTYPLDVYKSGTATTRIVYRNDTVGLTSYVDATTGVTGTYTNHDHYLLANNFIQAVVSAGGGFFVGCTATPNSTVSGIRWNNALGLGPSKVSAGSVTSSVNLIDFVNGNGVVGTINVNGTATVYSTSSDYRLKTNVAPMQNALDKVNSLNPVTFNWKADGSLGQGFIAHELQAVVPDCVIGEKDAADKDGNPLHQSVDTSFLIATLTAAIKELSAEVNALKLRN
jgi:hypothetical protein